jgi:hypothetical protein
MYNPQEREMKTFLPWFLHSTSEQQRKIFFIIEIYNYIFMDFV